MAANPPPAPQLSERELEILQLVAAGLSNKEIATRLFLSVNTVKVHLRNIFGKIGVQSRTEASMYAVAQGWLAVPLVPAEAPQAPAEAPQAPAASQAARPALPWPKRLALVLSVLLAGLGLALTWPRSGPAGSAGLPGLSEKQPAALVSASDAGGSNWQVRAQLPTPRGRLAVAAVRRKLYAIGGFTLTGVSGAVEVYDPQENDWSPAASKPLPISNISAAVLDERIYVPGGCDADGLPSNAVEVYDPALDRWSSDVAPLPAGVCAYAAAAYAQKLYVFGGSNGQSYLASSYAYDPQADRWTAVAPMPTPRGFAAAAVLGDVIYVVGGHDGQRDLAVCEWYRPQADEWGSCAPLAVGRAGLGLVALDNALYAIGGGWNGYLAFGERYTPQQARWSPMATPLIGQWRNLAAATLDSDIYALGGWSGQAPLSTNLVFSPYPVKIFLPFQSSQGK